MAENTLPFSAQIKTESFKTPEQVPTQTKKKSKNCRRFSGEQLKSLETIFEVETKLDQKKKIALATELGLQPRQVAIWFQNRRARCKSKQMEQDYRLLKANYDDLNSHLESLKKEKQSLLIQLQKLRKLQKCSHDRDKERSSSMKENSAVKPMFKEKQTIFEGLNQGIGVNSDDTGRQIISYLAKEEPDLHNPCEEVEACFTAPGTMSNSDLSRFIDQPCESTNWWDILTSGFFKSQESTSSYESLSEKKFLRRS